MFTLVVVDDNLAIIDLVAHGIDWSELGCSVVGVATDGTQGSALIVANQPDIIITDIHMPGFDGLKMIETTKVFSPHSKVIFISAYDDFRYAQEAISLRACAYLLKPFSKKELLIPSEAFLANVKKILPQKQRRILLLQRTTQICLSQPCLSMCALIFPVLLGWRNFPVILVFALPISVPLSKNKPARIIRTGSLRRVLTMPKSS